MPKTDYIKLDKDDAFENSFVTNLANQDIDTRANHGEYAEWRLINHIITNTYDFIALTYKEKLVPKIAPPGTSGNADESFKNRDRMLRTFENVIPDLQSRPGK